MDSVQQTARHGRRTIMGILGVSLMATVLAGGAAVAQDPQPSPESGTSVVTEAGPQGGTVVVGGGVVQAGPGVVQAGPGGCASWHTVTVGPDGAVQDERGGDDGTCAGGGPIGIEPFGPGGMVSGGVGAGVPGRMDVSDAARLVTVTAVNGTTVSLVTKDGWTKDVDATNVVITLDGATLTAADLAVGDTVQVDQTRNANDTYTITGLEVVLPQVFGVVATVGTDSFTLTQMDGTTTTVHISDATKWPSRMPGQSATGLASLTVGDVVTAQGKLQADGSMDASSVMAGGMSVRTGMGASGMMDGPGMMVAPPIPAPAGTPAPSPKG